MSSSSPEDGVFVELIASILPEVRLSISVIALFAYEYLITIDQEIALFWTRKKTGATWLFLATRYLGLISNVILVGATYAPMPDNRCSLLQRALYAAGICQYPVWAAFAALRTLALTDLNWSLASIVFILSCGPFAVNVWALVAFDIGGGNTPLFGCGGGSNATPQQAVIATAVSRSCAISADILVIAVTLRYMFKNGMPRKVGSMRATLANVLIVNGLIYFLALVTMNTLQLTLTLLSIVDSLYLDSDVTVLADPLSAILICRFLMGLQYANQQALDPDLSDIHIADNGTRTTDSLHFASRIIGSIGGSVAVGADMILLDGEDEDWRCAYRERFDSADPAIAGP